MIKSPPTRLQNTHITISEVIFTETQLLRLGMRQGEAKTDQAAVQLLSLMLQGHQKVVSNISVA